MLHDGHPLLITYKWARRVAVAIVGFTVLAVGIAMLVLPGPAFIVIPIGLGILGLEFAWARRWLRKVKERSASLVDTFRKTAPSASVSPPVAPPPSRTTPGRTPPTGHSGSRGTAPETHTRP
jgi:tellurite resistance protein TerC